MTQTGSAERLAKELDADRRHYEEARNTYLRYAFWHDVGVTALGAFATLALAVAEQSGKEYGRSIRVFVLFVTASITVFAACDHFFKFKAKVEEFGTAAKRVRALQSKVAEARDNSEEGHTPEQLGRLWEEYRTVQMSADLVSPDATVWRSPGRKRFWLILGSMVLAGLIAFAEFFTTQGPLKATAAEQPGHPAAETAKNTESSSSTSPIPPK
jgi:hypothetical protein